MEWGNPFNRAEVKKTRGPFAFYREAVSGIVTAMSSKEPEPDHIMRTGFAFWSSKALLAAIGLGLFTELAVRPSDAAGLEVRLGLHPRGSRDFLDALVAMNFLLRDGSGVYSNTTETGHFLDKNKPSYIGGIFEMANARLYSIWDNLEEGLRTGFPQNEAPADAETAGALYADPVRLNAFLSGMTGLGRRSNRAVASRLSWGRYKTFADIGAGQGDLAAQVALAHPHLTGVGFDLPATGPVFRDYMAGHGLSERVGFCEGGFPYHDFPKADVILMGHVLHAWSTEQKRALIAKAYAALPEGGMFVAYDVMIDDARRINAFGLLMSLNMLMETPAGCDYTGEECQEWLREAGFRDRWVEHLGGLDSMMVAFK